MGGGWLDRSIGLTSVAFPAPPTACDGLVTVRTMARAMYHDSVYGSSPPDCLSLFVCDIRLTLFPPFDAGSLLKVCPHGSPYT